MREREKGRKRISSRVLVKRGACRGAQSYDPEIMVLAENKSPALNLLSHPHAPGVGF